MATFQLSEIFKHALKEKESKKEKNKNTQKNKENSGVEQRFQDTIKSWVRLIEIMSSKVGKEQATRFLTLNPTVEPNLLNTAYCTDFHDFNAYFILRRDKENCENEELGQLAQLITAFQKEIDRKISIEKLPGS